MKFKILSIMLTLSFSILGFSQEACEQPVLEVGAYLLDGSSEYICAIQVFHGAENDITIAFRTSPTSHKYFCDVNKTPRDFIAQPEKYNTYIQNTESAKAQIRVLGRSAFSYTEPSGKTLTYFKYGF